MINCKKCGQQTKNKVYCSYVCRNRSCGWQKGDAIRKGKHHSLDTRQKMSLAKKGKPLRENHKRNIGKAVAKEKSGMWKGDEVSYSGLHKFMHREYGGSNQCENCGFISKNNRLIHWANITHIYNRQRKNWARLCTVCHKNYDIGKIKLTIKN